MKNLKNNKGALVELLKDEEVKAQIKAVIVELLGEDKWALLQNLLNSIGFEADEDTATPEPVKEPWYKKLWGFVKSNWMTIVSFFLTKKIKK